MFKLLKNYVVRKESFPVFVHCAIIRTYVLLQLTLRQDEKELEQTLQDRVLVSTILNEGLPK